MPLYAGFALKILCDHCDLEMGFSRPVIPHMPCVQMALVPDFKLLTIKSFFQYRFEAGFNHSIMVMMTRIKLKPKSPEFEEGRKKTSLHACDIAGCAEPGEFRAPKDRTLTDYYKFCKAHVSDYNRAWNYFDGMSDADVQSHMYESLFGHRPTWKYAAHVDLEEELLRKASGFRAAGEDDKKEQNQEERARKIATDTPEGEALEIMDLSPPITLDGIKARYKELAKQYHPDRNPNNPEAEEKLKDINMAYTVLRLAYQKYESAAEKFE